MTTGAQIRLMKALASSVSRAVDGLRDNPMRDQDSLQLSIVRLCASVVRTITQATIETLQESNDAVLTAVASLQKREWRLSVAARLLRAHDPAAHSFERLMKLTAFHCTAAVMEALTKVAEMRLRALQLKS